VSSLAERTSGYLRALRIPIFLIVVAVGLLTAYYSIYVSERTVYLTDRNLRLVAHLGRQVESSLADHETVLASYSNYYGPEKFVEGFACVGRFGRRFVPMFEYVSLAGGPPAASAPGQACTAFETSNRTTPARTASPVVPVLFVERNSGTTWTRRSGSPVPAGGSRFLIPIDEVLGPLLRPYAREGVFDGVVVATTSGRVIHEASGSDLRVTTLNRLARRLDDGSWKELDFSTLPLTSQVLDVALSGKPHKLYLQPCCAQLTDRAEGDQRPGWVVAGLVEAGAIRSQSMAVSFSMMALMAAAILFAVFSWPFVKLRLIGEGQRLRLIDVLLVGTCAFLGTALVTVFLVDWSSYASFKAQMDGQLQALSSAIRTNLRNELDLALKQLNQLELPNGAEKFDGASDLLARLSAPTYPLMESFALIDDEGMQTRKWAAASFATPRISVKHREYFRYWMGPHPDRPGYVLESIRSGTTGRKQAVLAKPAVQAGAAVAALTIPLVSLTEALLPPSFGFAVIDEQGAVLFHSDSGHSLDEQFFLETDWHRRLRAAVAARRGELVNVRYFGRDHRAYVAPIEQPHGARWSLVTFYDKEPVRTINIEWLVITLLLVVIYLTAYLLICGAILLWRPDYRASWIWPDPAKELQYQQLLVAYAALAAGFVAAIYAFRDRSLLAVALLLPCIAWVGTYVSLIRMVGAARLKRVGALAIGIAAAGLLLYSIWHEPLRALAVTGGVALAVVLPATGVRVPLRYPYRTAATLLLILTVVLPTLAFFKVAHAIQVESFIKYSQLDFARNLQRRTDAARHEMTLVGKSGPALADTIGRLRRDLSVYDRFFFETVTIRGEPGSAECDSAAGAPNAQQDQRTELPKGIEELLPYYSESSVGMRELLHDRSSDDNGWEWRRAGLRLTLQPRAEGGDVICVRSDVPQVFSIGGPVTGVGAGVASAALLGGILLWSVFWIARFIARRVLLIDVVAPLWARSSAGIPMYPGTHLFVCWRAADRAGRDVSEDATRVIDIAGRHADAKVGEWFERQRDRLEQAPLGGTIVIDRVDEGIVDGAFNDRKLALIREAMDVQHRTVVLISKLTPHALIRRVAEAAGEDAAAASSAWTSTLARLTVLDGARFAEGRVAAAAGVAGAGAVAPQTISVQAVLLSTSDDDADPMTRSVWDDVKRASAAGLAPALDREQLFEEVGDRLDSYHHGIWSSCSDAEKRVLLHLAQEGLVNEKDRRTIRVLLARGLVRKNPNFQIVHQMFRQFVLSRSASEEAGTLERHSDSPWDQIRIPFVAAVLGISAFFFLTQREMFTTTMAVVTALAGGIPAIVRVVGVFDRRSGTSSS
jgi:hypothetical protein